MPWTETIDAKTGERKRFFLSSNTWTATEPLFTYWISEHCQGQQYLVPFLFRLTWNTSRYGDETSSRYFVWRGNALAFGKRLKAKGYRRQVVEQVHEPGEYQTMDSR